MAKTWTYEYEGNIIEVKNGWTTELIVNGKQQDKFTGIAITDALNLRGKLPNGEEIKVTLGGGKIITQCALHISDVLQVAVSE
ncbi:MAG: hypothetical protein FWE92_05080 [Defluviitaleaceae bacterium]|nr:hypothetical protein [Defluviitaleaceae bacterium]